MATETQAVLDDKTRYEQIKKELTLAIPKKRNVDKQLAALESEIYKLEQQYLQETMGNSGGNIVHGFENFLKNTSNQRRKYEVPDADRIFSNSSVTIQKSLEMTGEGDDEDAGKSSIGPQVMSIPSSARSSHENKLLRDREYSRRRRNKHKESSVGTEGDDEVISVSAGRPRKKARMTTEDD